ncbi:hypothetical protein BC628DRAFT_1465202 [Trametes gibbosa]|nr:hypothetical protein BC628DRAFT_1465202 [Trametes gibbosa]
MQVPPPPSYANITPSLTSFLPILTSSIGAILIGTFLSLILYGVTVHQVSWIAVETLRWYYQFLVSLPFCVGPNISDSFIDLTTSLALCEEYDWLVSASFGTAIASDIITSGVLIVVLKSSKTGMRRFPHGPSILHLTGFVLILVTSSLISSGGIIIVVTQACYDSELGSAWFDELNGVGYTLSIFRKLCSHMTLIEPETPKRSNGRAMISRRTGMI